MGAYDPGFNTSLIMSVFPKASGGEIITAGGPTGSNLASAAGTYTPVPCGPGNIIGIITEVITTPGGAGSVLRLGLYDSNPALSEPLDLMSDTAVNGDTLGFKESATDIDWPGGVAWVLVVSQGGPVPHPTVRVVSTSRVLPAMPSGIVNLASAFLQANTPAGALPAIAEINNSPTAVVPAIGLRFA